MKVPQPAKLKASGMDSSNHKSLRQITVVV